MLAASGVPVLRAPNSADEGRVRASVIGVAIRTLEVEGLEIKELSANSGNAAVTASIAPEVFLAVRQEALAHGKHLLDAHTSNAVEI
ncbi:hypothetical protein DL770_009268 [Monosporascus sp. CRB-9-2]|nr:hypothetical protein DL770_009268 [Monosporascus sp. CRB-9-2]